MAEVELKEIESQIKEQLDRIYKLLDEGKSAEFIKVEYKRIVELISQKYLLLKSEVEKQKNQMEATDFAERISSLDENYKDDVIAIAVGIDNTLEGK